MATNDPSSTQAAQNARSVLIAGEDVTNTTHRNVRVLPCGSLVISPGPPSGGGPATGLYSSTVVGATEEEISGANPSRITAIITNNGFTTIYVGFDDSVTVAAGANGGTRLFPGGSVPISGYTGPIHAISDAAGGEVAVLEW